MNISNISIEILYDLYILSVIVAFKKGNISCEGCSIKNIKVYVDISGYFLLMHNQKEIKVFSRVAIMTAQRLTDLTTNSENNTN